MNLGKVLLVILLAFVGAFVIVGGCTYSGYNKAVTLDEEVQSAWAQVDNQLQRRFELIPNLVETVKGIAGHEEKVFLGHCQGARVLFPSEVGWREGPGRRRLRKRPIPVAGFAETYPQLRSNESFLKLQDSLEGTENRLSVERKRYNDAVKQLNTFSRKLLGRFYAGLAGVEKAEYFEISEEAKTAPKVDFATGSGG